MVGRVQRQDTRVVNSAGSVRGVRILVTNDDGWDAPGLSALKALAASLGEVFVIAPLEPQSYSGHRVTTDAALHLTETGTNQFSLSGTPADCVRVALTEIFPDVDFVLAGINRGGNLGADLYTSGTVAAAREAALLGKPAIAISQYIRRSLVLDWNRSREMAAPVLVSLVNGGMHSRGTYWNVNLPHLEPDAAAEAAHCEPDNLALDVSYRREGTRLHYSGTYAKRPVTPGRDVDQCFRGSITISRLQL